MKQRLRYILPLLALLTLWAACTSNLTDELTPAADGHTLTLTLATRAITRATEDVGDDRFRENLVSEADFYFFATDGQDATGPCLYRQTGVTPSRASGSQTLYNVLLTLDPDIIVDGQRYYLYVVANPPAGMEKGEVRQSLDEIKALTAHTDWKTGYDTDGTPLDDPTVDDLCEEALLMDGGRVVAINQEQTTPAVIDLTRAMAKVMLYASTEASIVVNGTTYTAVPTGMYATLVYSVTRTNLAGTYAVRPKDYLTRQRRDYNPTSETSTGTDGTELYAPLAPFYSYPNPASTTDRQDSYLILCVPWQARTDGSSSYQMHEYFYRVPITGSTAAALLERNHYYKVTAHIGVLGSLNPRDAVEVEAKFEIMDWFEADINADIQQYQYLVLDEYRTVLNNVASIDMPYISSSEIAWPDPTDPDEDYTTHIDSVTYWNYSEDTSREVTLTPDKKRDPQDWDSTINFDDFHLEPGPDGTLRFYHTLEEDEFFTPFTVTISVYNTQGVAAAEKWVITLYPAMYIVGENNDGDDDLSGGGVNRFINGYWKVGETAYDDHSGWGGGNYIGSVSELGGNNSNPNLYTIHISSFSDNTYAIGDPREETVYDFDGDLDATEYRRTSQDAGHIIAPAYKVASSWGKTTYLSYDEAVKRCASYQEAGYPAGRWRIPTRSEVEYIVGLSEEKKIPRLFGEAGSTTDYWVSSGKYNTENGFREDFTSGYYNQVFVRCVYDVWYWGDADIENDSNNPNNSLTNTDFVWGDDPNGELREGTKH